MVADPWPDPDDTLDAPGLDDLVAHGIESFFRNLVEDALNPLLELLGQTLLTTPTPEQVPRIEQLWEQSRQFSVASFVLVVTVAGIIVMGYETVQTRHSLKEILPRLVLAFLGANLSLLLADKAIVFANAASAAVMGTGLDPDEAAEALSDLVLGSLQNHGVFLILIGLAVAVMLIVLLVTYVVRVALTLILIAAAPLAIMCYALPQTEAVARWWWRAFAGVLAIQLGQSLTLIVFLRVFLDDDGFTLFGGATGDGMVNLLVCLALFYILVKIPFWIGAQVRTGSGRSFLGSLTRGFIAYKTLGLLKAGRNAKTAASTATRAGGTPGHGGWGRPPTARRKPPGGGNNGGDGPGRPGSPAPTPPPGTPSNGHTTSRGTTGRNTRRRVLRHDVTSRPMPTRPANGSRDSGQPVRLPVRGQADDQSAQRHTGGTPSSYSAATNAPRQQAADLGRFARSWEPTSVPREALTGTPVPRAHTRVLSNHTAAGDGSTPQRTSPGSPSDRERAVRNDPPPLPSSGVPSHGRASGARRGGRNRVERALPPTRRLPHQRPLPPRPGVLVPRVSRLSIGAAIDNRRPDQRPQGSDRTHPTDGAATGRGPSRRPAPHRPVRGPDGGRPRQGAVAPSTHGPSVSGTPRSRRNSPPRPRPAEHPRSQPRRPGSPPGRSRRPDQRGARDGRGRVPPNPPQTYRRPSRPTKRRSDHP